MAKYRDKSLIKVCTYLKKTLDKKRLQDLSNKCISINNACKGDGGGLSSGLILDIFISKYFKDNLSEYTEYHNGENDMKILNVPLSQKKINGKSTIALDWSKNISTREHFTSHIFLINLKTEYWWKKDKDRNQLIESGIYLIDKNFCKENIELKNNNKTNTLIDSTNLYIMLEKSLKDKFFIKIPQPNKELEFNILNSFNHDVSHDLKI